MSTEDIDFLSDTTEQTTTRFICFISPSLQRFDLAITTTNHFYGKKMVVDLQSGRMALIGPDDLAEPGYLEHAYKLKEEEAHELRDFLESVVGTITFSDD
jgi:hypothetical protein